MIIMYNIVYAIVFCIIVFFMWMSVIFSYADKKYGVERLFISVKKAIATYVISIMISIVLTVITYIIISFVQNF